MLLIGGITTTASSGTNLPLTGSASHVAALCLGSWLTAVFARIVLLVSHLIPITGHGFEKLVLPTVTAQHIHGLGNLNLKTQSKSKLCVDLVIHTLVTALLTRYLDVDKISQLLQGFVDKSGH